MNTRNTSGNTHGGHRGKIPRLEVQEKQLAVLGKEHGALGGILGASGETPRDLPEHYRGEAIAIPQHTLALGYALDQSTQQLVFARPEFKLKD